MINALDFRTPTISPPVCLINGISFSKNVHSSRQITTLRDFFSQIQGAERKQISLEEQMGGDMVGV